MRSHVLRRLLMASAGAAALSAGSALAQDSPCMQRLDEIQDELQQADVSQERRADVTVVVDGARTLGETGDEAGCERVLTELEGLMQTLTANAAAGPQQVAEKAKPAGVAQTQQAASEQPKPQDAANTEQAAADESGTDVTAKLTIDQPQPQITVHQEAPKVTVRIPKPIITVRIPPPEITIQIPDPDVQVDVPDPEIRVTMGQPEVQVEGAQAQGAADTGQQVQAKVAYDGGQQQAQVDVQMEDPEVRVEQADAQVDVARGAAQEDQTGQGQQMAALPADPTATGEPPATAEAVRPQSGDQTDTAMADQPTRDAAASATALNASPLAQMPATDLLGAEVVNAEGESVAEIVDMVKKPGSDEVLAVLSVGGFLGIGEKEVTMPLDRFEVDPDERIILSHVTEEELENLPEWDRDDATYEGMRP